MTSNGLLVGASRGEVLAPRDEDYCVGCRSHAPQNASYGRQRKRQSPLYDIVSRVSNSRLRARLDGFPTTAEAKIGLASRVERNV